MSKSRLKGPKENINLNRDYVKRGSICTQTPKFSFTYLTSNSKYNFSYCDKEKETKGNLLASAIIRKLDEISRETWQHWGALDKKSGGYEKLDYSRIAFKANTKLTPDENVYIFRFKYKNCDGKDGRILGIREDACPVFEIIGFDFDYSAYKH